MLIDPRFTQLAEGLIRFSTALKKGERVLIDAFDIPDAMVIALVRAARAVGGHPYVQIHRARITREMTLGAEEAPVLRYLGIQSARYRPALDALLDDLLAQFERMKAKGVHPYFQINHGMTLSAYYRDPDGNQVETQVDSMSMEEADAFMAGPLFAANPIGINVDFEELIARHRAGASFASITDYATAGK